MSLSPDSLSLSLDSLPAELRLGADHHLLLRAAPGGPRGRDEQREFGFYGLEADGALRPGGRVSLFTRNTLGLLLNYAVIGVLYGGLNNALPPFLRSYLQQDADHVRAAYTVLNWAWSFKFFGGFLTDSVRICGYRRKPYLVLGWTLCVGSLLYLGATGMPAVDSAGTGWTYTGVITLATVGYFLANVAADGLMVEYAQREPLRARGHTQVVIYASRMLGVVVADLFVAVGLNGSEYGGNFSFSLDFNQVMLVLAVCALVPLIGSVWLLHEDRGAATCSSTMTPPRHLGSHQLDPEPTTRLVEAPGPPLTFRGRCQQIWRLVQSRAMWQVLMFELVATFCQTVDSSASAAVEANWADAHSFSKSVSIAVWGLCFTAGLLFARQYLLQSGWGHLFCVATIWIVGVNVVTVGCTIFNVARHQYFWLYMQMLAAPAAALRFLVFLFPIVELAPRGLEGTTYGLIITFHNLAIPLGVAAYKAVDSYFSLSDEDVHADADSTRLQVTYTYLIAWALQLLSLAFVGLLPRQKLEVQQLRYYGGYSTSAGWLVVLTLIGVLVYTSTANVLALFSSTACLRIAGGAGCGD
ncbi:hypothetical protein BBJ28_00010551 [Nothophytophthora sp. Chile5]|nr:hypothetical protein BBJ28_00010551 [Nothophytophthora sp. Chile5]